MVFPSDFQVTAPTKGTQWVNGQTYPVTWTKGLLDGIELFDLELTRMNTEGLVLVARDGESLYLRLNIQINSVPPGDDYFLLFLNSTHGVLYGNSQSFSIVNSGSGNSSVNPLPSKPTVTVSGGPNPTAQFATTFAQSANGVRPWRPTPAAMLSAGLMSFALLAGAAAVL
ncbi:hypothetical protein B0F90DRAFT_1867904 [Multifurca ochricompacta]|uniref:Uncharacterized protein n=1 Tax=Multifurca ochricompacta TaxID=376703 RepID=A0AAD4M1N4_9AGAM|nr:hypothetical protein B0F90DRAFT_1867904 [Multifurca ochricompacta]